MGRSSTGVLGVLAVAAVVVAGCGGSGKSSEGGGSGTATTSSTTTKATTTTKAGAAEQATIATKSNPVLQTTILAAGQKKLTVYMFAADHGGRSACYGACAAAWPPVTTSGAPKAGAGVDSSKLGTITRTDGTKQVTYAGWPLYYYTPDTEEADISGQGISSFGAPWYVLSPSGHLITKK